MDVVGVTVIVPLSATGPIPLILAAAAFVVDHVNSTGPVAAIVAGSAEIDAVGRAGGVTTGGATGATGGVLIVLFLPLCFLDMLCLSFHTTDCYVIKLKSASIADISDAY
jgi:hypothetical protein